MPEFFEVDFGDEAPAPKPRGVWDRFKDAYIGGAVENELGAAALTREVLKRKGYDEKQINLIFRRKREQLAQKNADDPAVKGKGLDVLAPENIGRLTVDLIGGMLGGVDPTYVIAPGRTAAQRIIAQGAVNAGADAASQGIQIKKKIRDDYDPVQTGMNAAGGVLFQGGSEIGRKVSTGRAIRAGSQHPVYADLEKTVLGLEGGGTLAKPKTSPKGAKGPMQVMDATARDPGFGIRPWDGKTEADRARVGRQYLAALTHKYGGDEAKILAAYNAGPGRVDSALKKHGNNWLRHMPDETRKYVNNGFKRLNQAAPKINEDPIVAGVHEDVDARRLADLVTKEDFSSKDEIARELIARADDSHLQQDGLLDKTFANPTEPMRDIARLTPEEYSKLEQPSNFEGPLITGPRMSDTELRDTFAQPLQTPNIFRRLWEDESGVLSGDNDNVHNIADARQKRDLTKFHRNLMKNVRDRAFVRQELAKKVRAEGLLPFNVGDRFSTPKSREQGKGPWKVVDYFADPKDPERYGYYVERGTEGEDLERSLMLVSDPKSDAKLASLGHKFDRQVEVAQWKKMGIVKRLLDDESGSYRDETPRDYDESDPEQRLVNQVKSAQRLTGEQRSLYRQERAQRAGYLDKLQQEGGGTANYRAQLNALKGQLPKKDFESFLNDFTEEDIVKLSNKINFSNTLLPYEKVSALTALHNLLGPEGAKLPTAGEIKLLSQVFSDDFIKALLDNRSAMEKFWRGAGNALNLPRAIMSSYDLSAPLRQGIFLANRKEYWKSFAHMFKVFGSEDASKALMNDIRSRPTWEMMKKSGLAITDPHSHFLADREEAFMSDWAEKIPVANIGIKASNRAYHGFLNKLRADVFDTFVRQYEHAGVNLATDPKLQKDIAKFINAATGRGNMGKYGDMAAPALASVFFSPRLIASRVQMLAGPVTYAKADPILRREYWKSLLSYGAIALTVATLAKHGLGMTVEDDPRSSDFMKLKKDDTRFDSMGGFQQYVTLAARIITGETKTAKGDVKKLDGKGINDTRRDTFLRFLINKLAPVPSFASDALEGKNPVGEEFEWKSAIGQRVMPLVVQDIKDAYEEWGVLGLAAGVPAIFGVGVQTYKERPSKESTPATDGQMVVDFGDGGSDFEEQEVEF